MSEDWKGLLRDEEDVIECQVQKTPQITPYLFKTCPDLYKLIDEYKQGFKVSDLLKNIKDRYITIKGHIQSGKTKFMICASSLFLMAGYSVVIILRNNRADQDQIYERLSLFEKELCGVSKTSFLVCKTSVQKIKIDRPKIFLTLGNASSTTKIFNELEKNDNIPFIVFIDEVDYVDSGTGQKNEIIPLLKKNAHCVFGVSATIMDPLGKEDIHPKDVILLSLSPHYKGIPSIQVVEIKEDAIFTGKTSDNLFETDQGLLQFVKDFSKKESFIFADGFVHPNICLINICRTKEPTLKAQEIIIKKFPNLIVIVYNGDGIFYTENKEIIEYKGTISSLLQQFKNEKKQSNIIIFSGDLAGRGISFTSSDFKWHLTSMRLLVAPHCDEPELIQHIRLCGVYHDDLPLVLYSTKQILSDLKKAYFRQEEIVCHLKTCKDKNNCKDIIESFEMTKTKFTKRSPVKDRIGTDFSFNKVDEECGWDLSIYEDNIHPPKDYFEMYHMNIPEEKDDREYIIKMFKKWAVSESKIAIFMQGLDPTKLYTEKEMKEYVEEKNMKTNYTNLFTRKTAKSNGYGKILEKVGNSIRLYPYLVEEFKVYF